MFEHKDSWIQTLVLRQRESERETERERERDRERERQRERERAREKDTSRERETQREREREREREKERDWPGLAGRPILLMSCLCSRVKGGELDIHQLGISSTWADEIAISGGQGW